MSPVSSDVASFAAEHGLNLGPPIDEAALVAELERLRETFAQKHTMQFSKVAGYLVRSEDGKWCRISRRQFHNMVNAHVVRAGYEPKGFMWQTMCYRIREAIATVG